MNYGVSLQFKNGQSAAKLGEINMSVKYKKEDFIKKLNIIYPENKIEILEWNGYTKSIIFFCDICNSKHRAADARQLLSNKTYCKNNSLNNIRWDVENYNERLNKLFSKNIEILEYSGLSNKIIYKCPTCGKLKSCTPARLLLSKHSLCDECDGIEKNIIEKNIKAKFNSSNDFELLTWRGAKNKLTEKCLKCGYIYDRYPINVLECFNSCPNCNSGADKQKIDFNEIQKRIDNSFGENQYKLLDYKGQLNKHNKIKCLSCGLIFETHMASFIDNSRGCPKCKRFKSKGEQLVQKFLEENNIKFETQKRFKECNNNLSSFDFCAYDKNNKMYLIEVNGIQHYKDNPRFGGLEIIKHRDELKRIFCENNNIPLIIISYKELNKINDILSFLKGSTTIPDGSRE